MTDVITRNTIVLVQTAFFEVCDLIADAEEFGDSETAERLTEVKDLLATIEARLGSVDDEPV